MLAFSAPPLLMAKPSLTIENMPTSCFLGDTIHITIKLTTPIQLDTKGITITVWWV